MNHGKTSNSLLEFESMRSIKTTAIFILTNGLLMGMGLQAQTKHDGN